MRKFSKTVKISAIIIVILFISIELGNKVNIVETNFFHFIESNDYSSPYIYMMDRETESSIYEKNPNSRAYPASLTKIMTTIVALENIEDLSEYAPVDVETYKEMVASNASMAGFFGREQVTYRDLLYGTILNSGGEAANSLAVHVAGNVEDFVQMMNDKAGELGMNGTHFTNPEGLHNRKQYTTASDMARLLEYALDNSHFKEIFTTETFQTTSTLDHPNGILLKSTVLTALYEDDEKGFKIIGGKSGTTDEAGQCWATLGLVGGREYISIVMGAPLGDISQPDKAQIEDTIRLFKKISK